MSDCPKRTAELFGKIRSEIKGWNRKRRQRRSKTRNPKIEFAYKFGVLGIMKNEAMNIDEWVSHYLSVGAGKIFLIDNGSTDDTVAKAKIWVAKGVLELVEYTKSHNQPQHYWAAFMEMEIGQKCEWLLVADLDEFWFCPSGETIASCLDDFSGLDVIYANWRMFGSNGLEKHPMSIRHAFTNCAPGLSAHTERKYICRTSVVKGSGTLGIHVVSHACSSRTVSENERFHLNHYPIQSLEFFQIVKMTRGDASSSGSDRVRDMDYFNRYDAPCVGQDNLLANLVASGHIK